MPPARLDPRDVRIDPLLNNVSIHFKNELYIGPIVAPVIPTVQDGGRYPVYNQADWFRNEAGVRAVGTRAKRGDYGMTFDSYLCMEVAYAKEVPDELVRNAMDPIKPRQDAVMFASDKILLAKEVRVANKFNTAANWTSNDNLAGGNRFDQYDTSDPISVVENAIDLIQGRTGYKPNTMSLPKSVWKALKHHPDLVDRIKHSEKGIVTVQLLQELFEIPRILLAEAIYTTSNEGVAAGAETYQYVWGKHVWLGYVAPNPGVYTPTAMYQFQVGARGLRSWREEAEKQEVLEAAEMVDEKVVSKLLGHLIQNAVS